MILTDNTLFARTDAVMHADLGDVIAMMNIETGEYYDLNPAASRIWSLLEVPRSLGAICEVLVAEFAVTPESCREGTAIFLADLLERKIVRKVEA